MKGRYPKDPATRQRRNKAVTRAVLSAAPEGKTRAPSLPREQDWHRMTRLWWKELWRSPMAPKYLKVDVHALYRLAVLVDRFWQQPKLSIAAEIRQEEAMFGLTPLDRRRLEWIIEEADENPRDRLPVAQVDPASDPRRLLSIVS